MPDQQAFGSLAGLRAVVTGSSSGIGRAIALEFARGGANTVVHCRQSRAAAEETASAIAQLGQRASILAADLAAPGALELFAEQAWNEYGGADLWVNNAGVDLLTGDAAKLDYAEKLRQLLDVDVAATILLSRNIGRRMNESGGGVILNIGWDQADRGMEGDSGELFAAAKNAVMGFTRSLAVSLAPRVRVNCIAPGWIRTAWGEKAGEVWQERVRRETPLARWGTPEDVARTARFLASADAEYITGQVINVNGGAVR
ncbi:MAG: SDR family oxidoreductase [Planctomycetes bacterium]|nr:SDR family oxidoreductase [Planctomycetota bacterium]